MADKGEKKEKKTKKGAGEAGAPKGRGESKGKAETGKKAEPKDNGYAGARLRKRYVDEIAPGLMTRFGYKNRFQVPKLTKICVNMGVGEAIQNAKLLETAQKELEVIVGQRPAVRKAKKSISNFKLREGMPIGTMATLRGARMYEFLDRLISIAIPRIRDFRGLNPRSFDGRGNYTFGVKEQIIFPEVKYDKVEKIRGMDITLATTAQTDEEGFELLKALGMPFRAR